MCNVSISRLREAYNRGESDREYGFVYMNPYWTKIEVAAWLAGYKGEPMADAKGAIK